MIPRKPSLLLCCLLWLMPVLLQAQSQPSFDPAYQFVQSGNLVQDKNFYLLTLFEQEPVLHRALGSDPTLQQYFASYRQQANTIADACTNVACYANALQFDPEQIKAVAVALQRLYTNQPAFREALQQHLRPSGVFMRYENLPEEVMLTQRWKEEATGLNYILNAYTKNTGLRFPKIDSAAFDVKSAAYAKAVKGLLLQYKKHPDPAGLFFTPTLRFAVDLLQLNKKDHAARHEPLAKANQKAYTQVRKVHWNDYPYAAILVLGAGPDNDQPISPVNKLRCRTGAAIFRQNKAPVMVVSGGYVHPFGTKYSEAIEMKRFLMDSCKIPETAIIVEPHARHTTTNIRNTNRILFRNGFPADKKVLCTSSKAHLVYVSSLFFERVCTKDLGYLPFKNVRQLDEASVEYVPVVESLHEDPLDPLDP